MINYAYAYQSKDWRSRSGSKMPIRVAPADRVTYHDKTHVMSRYLGEDKTHLNVLKAGVRVEGNSVHDARVMPPEAVEALAKWDAEIRALHAARQEWLRDNFRTWPIVTRENAPKVIAGRSKAEAMRDDR